MKKFFIIILSLLLCERIYAEPVEYIYTDWFDYYPEDVLEIRIDSKDVYRWYKIDEYGNRIETEEYYDELEGYERIEESKKTLYRVINSDYIIIYNVYYLVKDTKVCRKSFCYRMDIDKYVPHTNNQEEPPEEEPSINPNTFDPIYLYYFGLIVCILLLLIINHKKTNDNIAL